MLSLALGQLGRTSTDKSEGDKAYVHEEDLHSFIYVIRP